jgi:arabinogalactan endo-1,4-beta-galactosidase
MKFLAALTTAIFLLAGFTAPADPAVPMAPADFAFGADLSFLKQAEDGGKVFRDGTNAMPALQIFRNHSYNWVRFRLFVEPVGGRLPNNLAYTLTEAAAAKKLGYHFLLDLHYASTWADPAMQPTPAAWTNLTTAARTQMVFAYTRDTLAAFRAAGVLPDMVQVGNEITGGMLGPSGRLPENWDNFAGYLRAGINGVTAGCGVGPRPQIMIHIDSGGKRDKSKWFFDKLNTCQIPFDVIGLSYYPWWQGPLTNLRTNLDYLARTYGKDIIVVEAAYYWKPNRETADRPGEFPETPAGQRQFLNELTRTVLAVTGGRGRGVFWWEPAVTGNLTGRGYFDNTGRSLPVLTVFDQYARPAR